jgi:predicted Mrr-cat superfamily restriction endonuclease
MDIKAFLTKESSVIKNEYNAVYGNEQWADDNDRNKAVYALDKIANQIKIGDKILIRRGNNKLLAIAEVTGDYKYKRQWIDNGIPHIRDVRYVAIAKDINLFDIMKQYLKKGFSMGHTIYYFGEVDHNIWIDFVEVCRNEIMPYK